MMRLRKSAVLSFYVMTQALPPGLGFIGRLTIYRQIATSSGRDFAMSYAAVMVYVDANGLPEKRGRLASSVAGKFNANLIGLSAFPIPPPFLYEGAVIQQPTQAAIGGIPAKLNTKGDWFRGVMGVNHAGFEWRPVLDYPAEALVGKRAAPILS